MEWGGSPPLCYAPADRGRGAHYAASISPCSNVAHLFRGEAFRTQLRTASGLKT
jgi:hypothetical protein